MNVKEVEETALIYLMLSALGSILQETNTFLLVVSIVDTTKQRQNQSVGVNFGDFQLFIVRSLPARALATFCMVTTSRVIQV
jgi:hypothetical protein